MFFSSVPAVDPDVLALIAAAKTGDCARISSLITGAARTKINGVDHEGKSALHHAAGAQKAAAISTLVAAGAVVNMRDHAGRTPLMMAYLTHDDLTVSTLLDLGADPTIPSYSGYTPVHLANNDPDLYKLMLPKAAKFPVGLIHEATKKLLVSIFLKKPSDLITAISEGADVNIIAADGTPALYLAALSGDVALVKVFMGKDNIFSTHLTPPVITEVSMLTQAPVSGKSVLELALSTPLELHPDVSALLVQKAFTMPGPRRILEAVAYQRIRALKASQSKVQGVFSSGAAAGGAGAAGPARSG